MNRHQATQNYLKHHFPVIVVHRLFARAWDTNAPDPGQREWGFETYPSEGGDVMFIRYKSCKTAKELHEMVSSTRNDVLKINLGPFFSGDPTQKRKDKLMAPMLREFVIDIDIDASFGIDASDQEECDRVMPLVMMGISVCIELLKSSFGFKFMMPVYSGRRGAHIWVFDSRASVMSDEARAAVACFCAQGTQQLPYRTIVDHPSHKALIDNIIMPFIKSFCIKPLAEGGLGWLDTVHQQQQLCADIDAKNIYNYAVKTTTTEAVLPNIAHMTNTPVQALSVLEKWCCSGAAHKLAHSWFLQTMCEMAWPKLDIQVSMKMNHLLKIPFSPHKNGRISIPVRSTEMASFCPTAHVPTVEGLAQEEPRHRELLHNAVRDVEAFLTFVEKEVSFKGKAVAPQRTYAGAPSKHAEAMQQCSGHDLYHQREYDW